MRRALCLLQPSSRRELALALALIRPGAKGARGLTQAELARRRDAFVFDDDAAFFLQGVLGCSEVCVCERERARARARGDAAFFLQGMLGCSEECV